MQTPTPFDLEHSMAQWRQELAAAEVSQDTARELESHLAASREDLQRCGLPPEEAFWLARRRLGSTDALADEFAKIDPIRSTRRRLAWFTAGLLASYAGPTVLSLLSTLTNRFLSKWGVPSGSAWLWTADTIAFLGMVGILAVVAVRAARNPPFLSRLPFKRHIAAASFAFVLFVSAICLAIGLFDSRLVGATPADGFGSMLFAGCAIERGGSSVVHAAFVVLWTAMALALGGWSFGVGQGGPKSIRLGND